MITDKDIEFYKESGYLLVRGVFNQQEVENMQLATDDIIKRAAEAKFERNYQWKGDFLPQDELKKLTLKGFHDAHYHDAAFTQALTHPRMVNMLRQLIGPNIQLHHSKLLVKPPEVGATFPMHQDYPYFPHESHTMMAASVHLDDADLENGCIHVIPGSHKSGPLPHVGSYYLNHKEFPVTMGTPCIAKAGDVLFFNYLTIHGSMQNRSSRIRRVVLFQYRAAEDKPDNDVHINWGQGMMISGKNPVFKNLSFD